MLSQVFAGLPPVSQRRNSEKLLIRFWKFSWPSRLFFVLDLSWFFTFLYNSLNTTSWVSRLFADFYLRVALLMQNYEFMWFKIQNSVIFGILNGMMWLKVVLLIVVIYKLASVQWVELIQHVYVMLKHVLLKPSVIYPFHSCQYSCLSVFYMWIIICLYCVILSFP